LEEWALRPGKPDWATGWEKLWTPGESGALARLDAFVNDDLENMISSAIDPICNQRRACHHICIGVKSRRARYGPGLGSKEKCPRSEKGSESF
jgi:deoxyribodipyrimidine photo-lyase